MSQQGHARTILGGGFLWQGRFIHPDGSVIELPPTPNLLPQQFIDYVAELLRATEMPVANWYLGLFENNYVPVAGVSAADLQTTIGESQAYASATRPLWNHSYDGTGAIDNLASKVQFTVTQDKTFYGSFICSSSVKGSNNGILASIVRFPTPQTLPAGAKLEFAAGLTLTPTTII